MSAYKFESDSIRDILKHIDPETLFILDIDHTIIEPVQSIGSTHWERHLAKKLMDSGYTYHEACIRAFHQWRTIQHLTQVRPVEESIYEFHDFLKSSKIETMGLTSRDSTLSDLTFEQLASVQLGDVFSFQKPCVELQGNYPCQYTKGAIFCGFNKKDHGLDLFLSHIDFKPSKIVFVDDQSSHIDELGDLSEMLKIDYVGMKYNASGVHKFDAKLADIQEKHLPKLLSDREALDLLEG